MTIFLLLGRTIGVLAALWLGSMLAFVAWLASIGR